VICQFKKTFLKDLAALPTTYRKKIEKLVFEDFPVMGSLSEKSIFGKCTVMGTIIEFE
jgi:hypothetical protein